jgi:outer membrane protein assembly complex protein YaeT
VLFRRGKFGALVLFAAAGLAAVGAWALNDDFRITFQGTCALSEGTLRKAANDELALLGRPGQTNANADDAAFAMQNAYRQAGFAWAQVQYVIEKKTGKTQIVFRVEEGPKVVVERLKFTGSTLLKKEQVAAFYQAKKSGFLGTGAYLYVEAKIGSAVSGIRDYYLNRGYLDVAIDPPATTFSKDKTKATLAINLHEGIHYRIKEIILEGDLLAKAQSTFAALRKEFIGEAYYKRRELLLKSRILEKYADLGYPSVNVEVSSRELDASGDVQITARISSELLIKIGVISVKGNEKTSEHFIRNRMHLKPGDLYSMEKQRASFAALYQTGLFSKVNLKLQKTGDPEKEDLAVRVQEQDSRELFLQPGWGSYELARLQAGFREKNLFGTGRQAGMQTDVSTKGFDGVGTLSDPWLLGSDIQTDLTTYYLMRTQPAYTRQEFGNTLIFSKHLLPSLEISLSYLYRVTHLYNVSSFADLNNSPANYNIGSLSLKLTDDSRNDYFYPGRGQVSFVSFEYADPLIGSQIPYDRVTFGTAWFWSLSDSTVLAARYNSGFIIPGLGQVQIPVGERFYNGGDNTVRSFNELQLGPIDSSGTAVGGFGYNVANLEIRQKLFAGFLTTLFIDYGNIAPDDAATAVIYNDRPQILTALARDYFKDFRTGLGAGLDYMLPVGPARLDFAFNPMPRSDRKESRFVIHFAIGMAF